MRFSEFICCKITLKSQKGVVKAMNEFARNNLVHGNKEWVLYGCGSNAIDILTRLGGGMEFAKCVDGDKNKQLTTFAEKYIVEAPSILDGKHDKYNVLVTPDNNDEICKILESYGYTNNIDYFLKETYYYSMEMHYYSMVLKYLKENQYDFKYILAPNIHEIPQPTKLEQSLKNLSLAFDVSGAARIEWLRSNPPHIRMCHKDLCYYSDDYIKNIFLPVRRYEMDGVLYQEDCKSKYVNCSGGNRITTDQPEQYDCRVHMFGPSHLYGYGSEDKYTIASCLQRLLNKDNKRMLVINYGIRGMKPEHYLAKIQDAHIAKNDLCILYLPSNKIIREFLMVNQIPYVDMNCFFLGHRPYDMFFDDGSHLNYRGNEYVTQCFYNIIFKTNLEEQLIQVPKRDQSLDDQRLTNALKKLSMQKEDLGENTVIGSAVMNCNPFTLGHYHLINIASQIVDFLYVFVVEEDKSEFPFKDRIELVKKGTGNLKNVKVLPGGESIVSAITFPEYFDREEQQSFGLDLSKDVNIFGKYIAPAFHINIRFVGEEPTDIVTRQYHETMKNLLPRYGVKLLEIPRRKHSGNYISAKTVRRLYHEGNFDELKGYVPETTYEFLRGRL